MIEPTESGSKNEIDRFISAMKVIRAEIARIEAGMWHADDNPHVNAPIPLTCSQQINRHIPAVAKRPPFLARQKVWQNTSPPVARIDNAYEDRNLVCTYPQLSDYELAAEWCCDIPESATFLSADMSQTISFTSLL